MHGGNKQASNPEVLMQHFGYGRQRIGRAGGHGEDVVPHGVIVRVIHAWHQGHIHIIRRRTDQHLAGAAAQVSGGILAPAKRPGRFNHHEVVHVLNEVHGAMADFLPHALPADQHGAALLEVIAFQDVQGFAGLDGLGAPAQ